MNLTFAATNRRVWQAVRSHYLTAVSLSVLAFAAVLASDLGTERAAGTKAPAERRQQESRSTAVPIGAVTYYLADSQERAAAYIAANAGLNWDVDAYIVVVTPESASTVLNTLNDATSAAVAASNGVDVRIVDLRGP